MGLFTAVKAFFRALSNREFSNHVDKLLQQKAALPPLKEASAVELLVLLQKEGRLVDFIQEDIESFSDAQIGSVVRSLHKGCRGVFQQYLKMGPILDQAEGSDVELAEGFDNSEIRIIGKVQGDPPFKGVLRHHGWKIAPVKLPETKNPLVILPAEVEL